MTMAEERPATAGFDRKRTGASYASQWNRFVASCEASGSSLLPATPEDLAAYLKDRWESGAKPSTLKVVAAAIARSHREAAFDVAAQQGVARTVLEELTQDDSPSATRALPLDLDCYLAPSGRLPKSSAAAGAGTRNGCPTPAGGGRWTWR